jgi:hypothetical protein
MFLTDRTLQEPQDESWPEPLTTSYIRSIVFPGPGKLRSRKVVSRSRARSTGKYPSWKMGRMMYWESTNELNAFRLLDCDPSVSRFHEQPCEIVYSIDGQTKSHFPDILVETGDRKELWEVKPESKALEREFVSRTVLLVEGLTACGYAYLVVLSHDLAGQPRLGNATILLRFGRKPVTDREREFIRLNLKHRGSLLWSDACSGGM